MIIERLILRNFGVYRGESVIELDPVDAKRPVVLFGGLNGCGKTTLLDAIQLALYGRQARCSNRGRLGYSEYLRRAVSRGTPRGERCGVEIGLCTIEDGEHVHYRIARTWDAGEESPAETLNVWRNGHRDPVLATRWADHVEELLPIGLSSLFFFDGEKIEKLADLERSKAIVADALHALLGLDTVDQLTNDLKVLERTKRKDAQSDTVRRQCEDIEHLLAANERRATELFQESAARQNDLDQSLKRLDNVEARFRAQGGNKLEEQKQLEAARDRAQADLDARRAELLDLAAGTAPLLLVADQLHALREFVDREREAEFADGVDTLLQSRDSWLLRELSQIGLASDARAALKRSLDTDRKRRRRDASRDRVADLMRSDQALLDHLVAMELPELSHQVATALKQCAEAEERLVQSEALLASIPDQERIADLLTERTDARNAVDSNRKTIEIIETERKRLDAEKADLQRKLERLLATELDEQTAHADNSRIIDHSSRVRATIEKFRMALVRRHTARIETLAHDSFVQLMRKSALVRRIEIDPESYDVRLYDKNGDDLPADRLSAGERQLLAVALLWGLARASGRPTPVAIDTPLGRLDSKHRVNLVERYFPNASHQVLLFSTDEEIDSEHLQRLQPFLGRQYLLRHDDAAGHTSVEAGYFG